MDSKNNIGHSADISFTAELSIPIYNGNNNGISRNWQICTRMNFWTVFFLSGLKTPTRPRIWWLFHLSGP